MGYIAIINGCQGWQAISADVGMPPPISGFHAGHVMD